MREYEFRGKCIETGDWFYGSHFSDGESTYIVSEMETSDDYGDGTDLYATWWARVDPKTVGQYTGLDDKNDIQGFQGDRWEFYGVVYTIEFDEDKRTYYLKNPHPSAYEDDHIPISELWQGEIIGNIHEDPQLVGEGK